MTDTIRVWPRAGVTVVDPLTRTPIEPGQEVIPTRFVLRRIADGDLLEQAPGPDKELGTEQQDVLADEHKEHG